MTDFIKNTLAMVIIGDEENKQFDGKIKMNNKNEYIRYHRDSIKKIVKELDNEGYSLGSLDCSNIHEAGFGLINMGHLLFCNCTTSNNTFGYLYLPTRLTEGQIESLRLFESDLQKFQQLYLMKIDESDNASFKLDESSYEFDVDQLIDTYYRRKTK